MEFPAVDDGMEGKKKIHSILVNTMNILNLKLLCFSFFFLKSNELVLLLFSNHMR